MSLVVTGASGHLGHLAVLALLDRGVPAAQIVATGRTVPPAPDDRLADLAGRGVTIRRADYTDPASLKAAFAGAEKILFVSSGDLAGRVEQHRNVVDAAAAEGVALVAYTSIPQADSNGMLLAADHRETEDYLRQSGVPFVFLRNSWYFENYTEQLPAALEHGVVLGSAGVGRISAASRADYAGAAAAALLADGQEGAVHELGGDEAFTMREYVAEVSRQAGKEVAYSDVPVADYEQTLAGYGLPAPVAAILADADAGVARGALHVTSGDLSRLLGRPSTRLADAIAAALR